MFDYYFAGSCPIEYLVSQDCNILRSYLNDRSSIPKLFEAKRNGWKGKLLIDNGAFTAHRKNGVKIDIDEYIKWINTNCQYFDYVIALDEIPGVWGKPKTTEQIRKAVEVTKQNYLYMREHIVCPEKLLPVVHMADGIDVLYDILKLDVDYICLSGSKDAMPTERSEWYRQCFDIISRLKPNIRVHCLGSGTLRDVKQFPFTSTDSTTSIKASSVGELCTDYGRVYIGEDLTKCKHVFNHKEMREYIEKKCAEYGINIENLPMRNKNERLKFNIAYYKEKSQEVETTFYDCKLIKRRLF